jgi:hypothetical protein
MGYKFNPFTGNLDVVDTTAAAGSTTEVQFNNSGVLDGSADLTWDDTGKVLGVGGDIDLDDGGTYTTTLQTITPTAARTISFPDATGTVALVAGSSGQVVYNNAGVNAGITAGTTGQVLVSQASGSVPVWGSALVSGTSVASTSGTSIDFTGIPSWVKRVTVMFDGVSTGGTSVVQMQLGAGSVQTSGYKSTSSFSTSAQCFLAATSGFITDTEYASASIIRSGLYIFTLLGSNVWVGSGTMGGDASAQVSCANAGSVTLSGTLDRVRITTVNGTDAFDAGSINILYE